MRSRWLDIDQVLFLRVYGARRTSTRKKNRGQYPAILAEQTWSIKDLLYGFRGNCSCGIAGSPERARWLHLACSGSQSQRAIWVILPAHGASHIIKGATKQCAGVTRKRVTDENAIGSIFWAIDT